jgi:hypothetical protein
MRRIRNILSRRNEWNRSLCCCSSRQRKSSLRLSWSKLQVLNWTPEHTHRYFTLIENYIRIGFLHYIKSHCFKTNCSVLHWTRQSICFQSLSSLHHSVHLRRSQERNWTRWLCLLQWRRVRCLRKNGWNHGVWQRWDSKEACIATKDKYKTSKNCHHYVRFSTDDCRDCHTWR